MDPGRRRLRAWFTGQAERRDLAVETDNNGNLWAWWGPRGPGAIATGSHLDSVPTAAPSTARWASYPPWPPWTC